MPRLIYAKGGIRTDRTTVLRLVSPNLYASRYMMNNQPCTHRVGPSSLIMRVPHAFVMKTSSTMRLRILLSLLMAFFTIAFSLAAAAEQTGFTENDLIEL